MRARMHVPTHPRGCRAYWGVEGKIGSVTGTWCDRLSFSLRGASRVPKRKRSPDDDEEEEMTEEEEARRRRVEGESEREREWGRPPPKSPFASSAAPAR